MTFAFATKAKALLAANLAIAAVVFGLAAQTTNADAQYVENPFKHYSCAELADERHYIISRHPDASPRAVRALRLITHVEDHKGCAHYAKPVHYYAKHKHDYVKHKHHYAKRVYKGHHVKRYHVKRKVYAPKYVYKSYKSYKPAYRTPNCRW